MPAASRPNTRLGIPALHLEDGPAGVAGRVTGVTPTRRAGGWCGHLGSRPDGPVRQTLGAEEWGKGAECRARPDDQHRTGPAMGPGI